MVLNIRTALIAVVISSVPLGAKACPGWFVEWPPAETDVFYSEYETRADALYSDVEDGIRQGLTFQNVESTWRSQSLQYYARALHLAECILDEEPESQRAIAMRTSGFGELGDVPDHAPGTEEWYIARLAPLIPLPPVRAAPSPIDVSIAPAGSDAEALFQIALGFERMVSFLDIWHFMKESDLDPQLADTLLGTANELRRIAIEGVSPLRPGMSPNQVAPNIYLLSRLNEPEMMAATLAAVQPLSGRYPAGGPEAHSGWIAEQVEFYDFMADPTTQAEICANFTSWNTDPVAPYLGESFCTTDVPRVLAQLRFLDMDQALTFVPMIMTLFATETSPQEYAQIALNYPQAPYVVRLVPMRPLILGLDALEQMPFITLDMVARHMTDGGLR